MSRYKAEAGKKKYLENRQNSVPNYHCLEKAEFLEFVVDKVRKNRWSLDACVGYALQSGMFRREEIVCTKTLYNYVDMGFLPIKNIDLPEKLHRKKKSSKVRENKRIFGSSIREIVCKTIAVKSVQAILGTYPNKSIMILRYTTDSRT